jgi:phosphoglycerol transferase MdoB-like AlkP superfamily enzyme
MQEKGYYTFSMHANNATFWNRNVMHKNLGYQKFYSKEDYEVTEENTIGLGLSDESFYEQSITYLKDIKANHDKFYGTLISLSNHTPFSDVEKYGDFKVSLTDKDENGNTVEYNYLEGTKLGNYLKSVHYADKAFGEFIENAEKEGLLDNTVIVLYGDHDARLPKKDFQKMYNYDKETDGILSSDDENYIEFGTYQYELNRKTPFIIWTKKYALGHDIFDIKSNNIVVFPNSNFVTNKVYYNSQKGEYLALTNDPISEDYIEECNEYASQLLDVSNDVVVYDLIKKERESEESYTEEGTSK